MEGTMGAVDRAAGQESGMSDIGTRVEWYRSVSLKDAETYISENLKAAARNVIAIGYYLKHIRDRELYQEAGYTDIWAYAHDLYGFSKSTTSRYMSRNDKFSQNGDSPILDDKYRDYGKAQLQEMLSLDEEQLERVTPDMTARQIREMRKPKDAPVPYVELPGQVELLDLLSDPMEDEGDIQVGDGQVREGQQGWCTVVSVSDLLPGTGGRTSVATSQQDKRSSCPPQVPGCRRQEWGTSPEQQKAGQKECDKCWAEWEERQRLLDAAGEQWDPAEAVVEELEASTIGDGDSAAEGDGVGSDPEENTSNGTEDPEKEGVGPDQPAKTYDKAILERMIKDCEDELEIMQEYWVQHMPDAYTECVMQLRAYKDLLAAEAEEELAEESIGQPPLPVLKNNDQRKAWLDTYHEWPVWYEVPQAGEVYYRYDLKDGYSLVICEYHTYQEWREQYKKDPEVTRTREYILTPGYHYLYDCQSSRTGMIEHLKEMQKKGKDDR